MTKLITPSTNEYQLQVGLDTVHAETVEWLSELEFHKTELSFLNKLLDKYFLRIESTSKQTILFNLDKKLREFKLNDIKLLHNIMTMHENRLGALDENMFSQDEQVVREEHEKIRRKIKIFTESLQKIKKEIFSFVEKELTASSRAKH